MDDGRDKAKLLDAIVRERFAQTRTERQEARKEILKRQPLQAEPDTSRALRYARSKQLGPEALQGDSIDYLPSWFLTAGSQRSRAVARLTVGGSSIGTGFLISPELLITNNHVLGDPGLAGRFSAEFNYENGEGDHPEAPTVYALDAHAFWLTNPMDNLDFTIVALGERLKGALTVDELGFVPLSDSPDKHALGMCVNIIQHPMGRRKQVVVRENRLLARGGQGDLAKRTLHYSADTEEGASGSPVFNDNWDVVALHHWGIPHLDTMTVDGVPIPLTVNEGVRISVIVGHLKDLMGTLPQAQQPLLQRALDPQPSAGQSAPRPSVPAARPESAAPAGIVSPPGASGLALREFVQVINVPLEVRVSIAGGVAALAPVAAPPDGAAERVIQDRNYGNRNGYEATFIPGVNLPLADVVGPRLDEVAPLVNGQRGADAVLHYQNFSLMMNKARKLAFCTATNIDAATYVEIDRDTGLPRGGPEGESWFDDDRIDRNDFVGQSFYSDWSVYFDRGHLTRRTDPTWGEFAVRANADTFHRTNCTPQHFRFNQSTRYWQGAERYILENGALEFQRKATVLTGPVLDGYSKTYGNLEVPMQFWKVIVWPGRSGQPEATALLLDQAPLLHERRGPLGQGGDIQIDTFRVSLKHLARVTGLDFSALAPFDTYVVPGREGGAEAVPVRVMNDWSDLLSQRGTK